MVVLSLFGIDKNALTADEVDSWQKCVVEIGKLVLAATAMIQAYRTPRKSEDRLKEENQELAKGLTGDDTWDCSN